jgi:arginine utilization protein RocB
VPTNHDHKEASMATATGTRDKHYDLISVLYHSLQGAETVQMYIEDAREAGDDELRQLFEQTLEDYRKLGDRTKQLLSTRLQQS